MIFDAVISLFSLVVDFIAGLLIAATFPIVNAVFALIELVVGLFTSAFSLPRLDRATAKDSSKPKKRRWLLSLSQKQSLLPWKSLSPSPCPSVAS